MHGKSNGAVWFPRQSIAGSFLLLRVDPPRPAFLCLLSASLLFPRLTVAGACSVTASSSSHYFASGFLSSVDRASICRELTRQSRVSLPKPSPNRIFALSTREHIRDSECVRSKPLRPASRNNLGTRKLYRIHCALFNMLIHGHVAGESL